MKSSGFRSSGKVTERELQRRRNHQITSQFAALTIAHIAAALRRHCNRTEWNAYRIEKQCGVTRQMVERIMNGESKPSVIMLICIVLCFGENLAEFLGRAKLPDPVMLIPTLATKRKRRRMRKGAAE